MIIQYHIAVSDHKGCKRVQVGQNAEFFRDQFNAPDDRGNPEPQLKQYFEEMLDIPVIDVQGGKDQCQTQDE